MKIPESVLTEFEKIIDDLQGFGLAKITVSLHDHKPRFILNFEKSIVPGKNSSGGQRGERFNEG